MSDRSSDQIRFFTIDEVAERLRVHRRTVCRWIEKKLLEKYHPGGRLVRIRESDLEAFLAKHRAN